MCPSVNSNQPQRWQPVEGNFSRNFFSDFGSASPKTPNINPDSIVFPSDLERIIEKISRRNLGSNAANTATIAQVQETCRAEGAPDYSQHSGAFFNLYFAKNLRKAASVIVTEKQLCTTDTVRILDIGAGAGASAIGAIYALLTRENPPKRIIVDLIEQSSEQTALAQEILHSWVSETKVPISFRILQSDAVKSIRLLASESSNHYDLVMSSYLLTELANGVASALAVELQFFAMRAETLCPALLFMGSYLPGNHFGYYLHNPAQGDPDFGAVETILKAFGVREEILK